MRKVRLSAPGMLMAFMVIVASLAGCFHPTGPPPCESFVDVVELESLVGSPEEFDKVCLVTYGFNRGLETFTQTGFGSHYKYRFSSQPSGDAPTIIVELMNEEIEDESPEIRWEVSGRFHFHPEAHEVNRAFFIAAQEISRA